MKKIFIYLFIVLCNTANAKHVKFMVNMNNVAPLSAFGIHIMGDFQSKIGLMDFDPATCKMDSLGNGWYSYYANLPANNKYEYIYLNGDQTYETEIVPWESRVEYDTINGLNFYRWFYLDSTANDTTLIGGFDFGTNAPLGKELLRFLVDYKTAPAITSLPTVTGTFNNWGATKNTLWRFKDSIYEGYVFVNTNSNHEWKFKSSAGVSEVIVGGCANGQGNRYTQAIADIVLDTVCFNACTNCFTTSLANYVTNNKLLKNNITNTYWEFITQEKIRYQLLSINGVVIKQGIINEGLKLEAANLPVGMYILKCGNTASKLIKF